MNILKVRHSSSLHFIVVCGADEIFTWLESDGVLPNKHIDEPVPKNPKEPIKKVKPLPEISTLKKSTYFPKDNPSASKSKPLPLTDTSKASKSGSNIFLGSKITNKATI